MWIAFWFVRLPHIKISWLRERERESVGTSLAFYRGPKGLSLENSEKEVCKDVPGVSFRVKKARKCRKRVENPENTWTHLFCAHQKKKGFSFFSCGATPSGTVPKTQPLEVAFSLQEREDLRFQEDTRPLFLLETPPPGIFNKNRPPPPGASDSRGPFPLPEQKKIKISETSTKQKTLETFSINSVQTRCIVKGEAQKSPLFWRFSGFLWFSQDRLVSRNSTRKPLNLIKSPMFTNTPCKSTCLYNAPSMHAFDSSLSKPSGCGGRPREPLFQTFCRVF